MSMKRGHGNESQHASGETPGKAGVRPEDAGQNKRPLDDSELEGVVGGTGNSDPGLEACDLDNPDNSDQQAKSANVLNQLFTG